MNSLNASERRRPDPSLNCLSNSWGNIHLEDAQNQKHKIAQAGRANQRIGIRVSGGWTQHGNRNVERSFFKPQTAAWLIPASFCLTKSPPGRIPIPRQAVGCSLTIPDWIIRWNQLVRVYAELILTHPLADYSPPTSIPVLEEKKTRSLHEQHTWRTSASVAWCPHAWTSQLGTSIRAAPRSTFTILHES